MLTRDLFMSGPRSGEVTVTFTVTADNQIRDIAAIGASHPRVADWAVGVVRQLHCSSGGQEEKLSLPFSYRIDTFAATREDIPFERFEDVIPRISTLKAVQDNFNLRIGQGINIHDLRVLAYDKDGQFLGRLRDLDRDAKPKEVLTMLESGIVQATSAGEGVVELSAPRLTWKRLGAAGSEPPSVRVRITVSN